jgi:hypothetical protein
MYINCEKATRLGLIGRVKVYLNGRRVNECISAKPGRNGFAEAYITPLKVKNNEIPTVKKRGNVKISFSPKRLSHE